MAESKWSAISTQKKVSKTADTKKTHEPKPHIGIAQKTGTFSLNCDAYSLLGRNKNAKFVQALRNADDPNVVGFSFGNRKTSDSFPLLTIKNKSGEISGLRFASKALVRVIFGNNGTGSTDNYPADVDVEDKHVLVIHLDNRVSSARKRRTKQQ
jgi:hypothetical protein